MAKPKLKSHSMKALFAIVVVTYGGINHAYKKTFEDEQEDKNHSDLNLCFFALARLEKQGETTFDTLLEKMQSARTQGKPLNENDILEYRSALDKLFSDLEASGCADENIVTTAMEIESMLMYQKTENKRLSLDMAESMNVTNH